jgi:hypothetical protein
MANVVQWRSAASIRTALLAPLYVQGSDIARALFDIIHSSKFAFLLKKGGDCFVAKGISMNRESK